MKRRIVAAALLLMTLSSPALADKLNDVLDFCRNNTGAPRLEHAVLIMPDGKPRGTRPPATLTAEARQAKARGDCDTALRWLKHAVEHDEGAKNVLGENPSETCKRL